jgi:hypothetical protein
VYLTITKIAADKKKFSLHVFARSIVTIDEGCTWLSEDSQTIHWMKELQEEYAIFTPSMRKKKFFFETFSCCCCLYLKRYDHKTNKFRLFLWGKICSKILFLILNKIIFLTQSRIKLLIEAKLVFFVVIFS